MAALHAGGSRSVATAAETAAPHTGGSRSCATVPTISGTWNRKPACRFRLPAAMGTLWRARDGRRLACFVNASGQAQTFTYRLDDGPMRTLTLPPRSVRSVLPTSR